MFPEIAKCSLGTKSSQLRTPVLGLCEWFPLIGELPLSLFLVFFSFWTDQIPQKRVFLFVADCLGLCGWVGDEAWDLCCQAISVVVTTKKKSVAVGGGG